MKNKKRPVIKLDEEALKEAAQTMSKVAHKIQEQMIEAAIFGDERAPYGPHVSTGRMASSIARQPFFGPFMPRWDVVSSPYVIEEKKVSRKEKRTFWQKLWTALTDLNPWPYCPIEYFEIEVPAMLIDRRNHKIMCHPALEGSVRKAIQSGDMPL